MEELVGFVNGINWAANCMKLVIGGLECPSVVSVYVGATLHQLEVVFETNITCFRSMVASVFQGSLNLTRGGESNNLCHGFLREGGKK